MAQLWWKVFIEDVEQDKRVRAADMEGALVRARKVFRIKENTPHGVSAINPKAKLYENPPRPRRPRRVRRTAAAILPELPAKKGPAATLYLVLDVDGPIRDALDFIAEVVDKAREQGSPREARVSLSAQEFDWS